LLNRLNIGAELSVRKLFGDGFDAVNNPYDIQSSVWKNKDWYVMLQVSVTWDFGLRCGPCNNEQQASL
jgi:hypothetical protein